MSKFFYALLLCPLFLLGCKDEVRNEDDPIQKSSEKKILSYKIEAAKNSDLAADIVGVVDEQKKEITFSAAVPSTKPLIATFTAVGSVYVGSTFQISGTTANSYAENIKYTVVAEDDSRVEYTVKPVSTTEGSEKKILTYKIEAAKNSDLAADIVGVVDEQKKEITFSTAVPSAKPLIATFTAVGSVYVGTTFQISGTTANSYAENIKYTVVAEDDSRVEYTVKPVSTAEGSEKKILTYKIEAAKNSDLAADIVGVVNEQKKEITFSTTVPSDKPLIATFTAVGSVYVGTTLQTSGTTANSYAENIIYTVVAEDDSSVEYTLKPVFTPPGTGKWMGDYSLTITQQGVPVTLPGTLDEYTNTITITIPQATNRYYISNIASAIATFESEGTILVGGTEQVSGTTPNDFRKEVNYTAKAEDGSTTQYKVALICPQSTGLPVVCIDTNGGAAITSKDIYTNGTFSISDPNNPQYDIAVRPTEVRGRGNSTWGYPKKPYRIKLNSKTSIFGLGSAKSWVLLANYLDQTMICNTVALELGRRFGLPYTNHANHVELFLNGQHKGSYVFTEQVQVNEHRVNISETDGYLLELDSYYDEPLKFKSPSLSKSKDRPLPVNVKSPEVSSLSEIPFVQTSFNNLINLMFNSPSFPDSGYRDLLDMSSLIDFILINEIVGNGELHHPKSTYLYKDAGSKISFGPLWDFDWAFGYTGSHYFTGVGDMLFSNAATTDDRPGRLFFKRFFDDPTFRAAYKIRWNQIKGQLSDIGTFVQQTGTSLDKSFVQNEKIWNTGFNYQAEITKMKNWLNTRIQTLDTKINAL